MSVRCRVLQARTVGHAGRNFIHRKDGQPILMAVIGSTPFERGDEEEGFLIVTAAADKGLVDIHDRRPLVLVPDAAREWMKQDVSGKEAEQIAADAAVSADIFFCIQGYKKERKVKDAFKGGTPGLIASLMLMAVVQFVKDENDCSNKYGSGNLPASVCETLKGPGFR